MRIACVQNGDYTTALRNRLSGGAETYNGQFYTVDEFRRLVGNQPHLVLSLDASPHESIQGSATLCAIAEPGHIPGIPRRITLRRHAARIIRRLEEFEPTHLLIRCCDVIACELLQWANDRGTKTAAIIAAQFAPAHPPCRRFCELANDPNVLFVANHNRVATETLVECGLDPEKAIAWDLPPAVTPEQYAPKTRGSSQTLSILFAGVLRQEKGVDDLIRAAEICRDSGLMVDVTLCGDGPMLPQLRKVPGNRQGWLHVTGQLPLAEVIQRMSHSDLVVVPSRKSFAEGMPFVIHESLAVRTPLLLSSHPVFARYFTDRRGIRFFQEGDAASLARAMKEVATDGTGYERLSLQTAEVWLGLQCSLKFGDVLQRLGAEWQSEAPAPIAV
jgi:glycosyltransferase involved in cell wall biosynthesis